MTPFDKFKAWARREPDEKMLQEIRRQVTADVRQAMINDGNDEYMGWRNFLGKLLSNDITPQQRSEIVKVCRELVKRDPMAKRIVEIPVEFIEAAGYNVQADDKIVEKYLNAWLDKIRPAMGMLYSDSLINGELCNTYTVNQINGELYRGYIDTLAIDSVEYWDKDFTKPRYVILRKGLEVKQLEVIQFQEYGDELSFTGDCFFWANMPMAGMSRGLSVFTAEKDYILLFEKFMRSEASRAAEFRSWLWQFIIEDSNSETQREFYDKNFPDGKPPTPGSVFVTDQKIKIEDHAPALNSYDSSNAAQLIGKRITAGAGQPNYWHGEGENTNVATAREISIPTVKKLIRHQNVFISRLVDMCKLYYVASLQAGVVFEGQTLPRIKSFEWKIVCGEIFPRDMVQGAQTCGAIFSTAQMGRSNKMVSQSVADQMVCKALGEIGIVVTPAKLREELEDEAVDYEIEQMVNELTQKRTALETGNMPKLNYNGTNDFTRMARRNGKMKTIGKLTY